jgi:DNA-3-methyladenine glycosylase
MVAYTVMNNPTDYTWLRQDSLVVAPLLLSWELVSVSGGVETAGRIVEVEAYHGPQDPASHAYRGLTPRTAPMFGAGGAVYVYLSYGVHTCVNIVTGGEGEGQAVLIRALEPTTGLDAMAVRRRTTDPLKLCSGPGKLGQALGIGLDLSGSRLGETLSLRPAHSPAPEVAAGPRIGISKAIDHPWRFYVRSSRFISRRPSA